MQFEENDEKPLILQGKKDYINENHIMNQDEEQNP